MHHTKLCLKFVNSLFSSEDFYCLANILWIAFCISAMKNIVCIHTCIHIIFVLCCPVMISDCFAPSFSPQTGGSHQRLQVFPDWTESRLWLRRFPRGPEEAVWHGWGSEPEYGVPLHRHPGETPSLKGHLVKRTPCLEKTPCLERTSCLERVSSLERTPCQLIWDTLSKEDTLRIEEFFLEMTPVLERTPSLERTQILTAKTGNINDVFYSPFQPKTPI